MRSLKAKVGLDIVPRHVVIGVARRAEFSAVIGLIGGIEEAVESVCVDNHSHTSTAARDRDWFARTLRLFDEVGRIIDPKTDPAIATLF